MCMVSAIYDQFRPVFPEPQNPVYPWVQPPMQGGVGYTITTPQKYDVDTLSKLIKAFYTAEETAKLVDALTGQPDCADPEKEQLRARVEELEAKLAAIRAAVSP